MVLKPFSSLALRISVFKKRLFAMLREPVFIWMTILVNGLVLISACLLYFLEHEHNPNTDSFLKCFYWAMSTVTTVGYGDVVATSELGRILAIALMMLGSLAHVFYTAIFAASLLSPELTKVKSHLRMVSQSVHDIQEEVEDDDVHISELQDLMNKALKSLEALRNKQ